MGGSAESYTHLVFNFLNKYLSISQNNCYLFTSSPAENDDSNFSILSISVIRGTLVGLKW